VLQTVLRLDVLKNLLLVNNNFGMPLVILKLSVCPLYTYISSIKLPNMLLTLVVFFLNIVFLVPNIYIYTMALFGTAVEKHARTISQCGPQLTSRDSQGRSRNSA